MMAVLNNWTSYFQPLDIFVNKPYKDFLRNEMQTWYSNKVAKKIAAGKKSHQVKVDTTFSIIKPFIEAFVSKFYDHIRLTPNIVINGWKKSLILKHALEKIHLDPFSTLRSPLIDNQPSV